MDIQLYPIQMFRVIPDFSCVELNWIGYRYDPNCSGKVWILTHIKKNNNKKKSQTSLTVTHESHSLCFSSVLTNTLFLSLSKLSSLHLSSLSLSLSLSLFCAWFLFLLLCESTGSFYHSLSSGKWLILFPSFASLVSKEKYFLWVSGFDILGGFC